MRTGHQISAAFRNRHGWRGNDYVDAEGYKYENWARNSSGCSECMFVIRYKHKNDTDTEASVRSGPCCLIFDEKGMSRKDQGRRTGIDLKSPRDCEFYLKRDFSEGDSEDEKIRSEVEAIAASRGFQSSGRSAESHGSSSSKKSGGGWVWILVGIAALYFFSR